MEDKHFFVVHTFISDETRKEYLTPPEKRDPPQKNLTEREWAERAKGQYARCMRNFMEMMNFSTVTGLPRVSETFIDSLKRLD